MAGGWATSTPGILVLPSGRAVRGRSLRAAVPVSEQPDLGVYLSATPPDSTPWPARWVRWRDFRTPSDPVAAREVLVEVWERSAQERVEVACHGGRGRTGTALACLAVLDGVPPDGAVAFVRQHYDRRAVETPWQRRYVARFGR